MPGMDDVGRWSVTKPLRDDYVALEPVLDGIAALADRVRVGQRCHALLLTGGLACLEAFQRRHDEKVERVLFRALSARDPSSAGDVALDVTHMHRGARRGLSEVRRGAEGSCMLNRATGELAAQYVASLRAHAAAELEGVFATADRVLSDADVAALWEAFRQVDEREARPGEEQARRALAQAIDPRRDPRSDGVAYTAEIVAAHVMRPWPRALRPADTLARAAELMDQSQVRELPVLEHGRLCGILSRSDLQAHSGHLEWTGVDAAMTTRPVVVTPEQSVGAVSQVLMRGSFNAVPVVAEDATLIGMISRSDLLKAVAQHNGDGR